MVACKSNHDCIDGFFCKNNDCIAKRSEGSLCLSSENYECMCGKCTLNSGTWNKVCLSDYEDGECSNGGESSCIHCFLKFKIYQLKQKGSNPFNNCKSNDECPRGYFCDIIDGKVCSSKLAAGRLCFNDEMCACGKCAETSHISRPNKPPIKFNVCNSC